MLKLQTQLGQQLAITPQLQQAIQLLQLPTLALETQIQTLLQENVMLESVDEADMQHDIPEPISETQDSAQELDYGDSDTYDAGDWPVSRGTAEQRDGLDPQRAREETLRDHLLWQLEMSALAPDDLAIGVALIDNLDEDGYLNDTLSEIRRALAPDLNVTLDQVECVLRRIQHFDPVGVAARDLSECLHVQIEQMRETPALALAKVLIDRHLNEIAGLSIERLARRLGASVSELQDALKLVRALEPRPGRGIGATAADIVVPDVVVTREPEGWQVRLNSAVLAEVRVHDVYAGMLKRAGEGGAHVALKSQLQEARWFVRSLAMRHQTVLKVAQAVVAKQIKFLERGEEHLNPLILKDIAAEIDMHESTVSRVVSNKFMQTPRGTIEFKAFFSQAVNANAGQHATRAIRARLKKLILAESPVAPLSDGALAAALARDGIEVARRTVAKYRDSLGFATCQQRKRQGAMTGTRLAQTA